MILNAITIYIYQEELPNYDLVNEVRCINCGRLLMKIKGHIMAFTNTEGTTVRELPLGITYVQHSCHNCKTMYNVLFQ